VIVFLLLTGNYVRAAQPMIGVAIMLSAVVVFVERFLWSWYVSGLNERRERT
jgi:uncharacterized protein (DUF2062 family)